MTDWQKNYWSECVSAAADECGLLLAPKQLDCLVEGVRGGHEHFGMASGHDVASANLSASREREVADLKRAIKREKDKVHCTNCNGRGRVYTFGGTMMSNSECWKCHGEGRHDP